MFRSINELSSKSAIPVFFALSNTSGIQVTIPGSSPPSTTKIKPSSSPAFSNALNIFVGIEIMSPGFKIVSSLPSDPQ